MYNLIITRAACVTAYSRSNLINVCFLANIWHIPSNRSSTSWADIYRIVNGRQCCVKRMCLQVRELQQLMIQHCDLSIIASYWIPSFHVPHIRVRGVKVDLIGPMCPCMLQDKGPVKALVAATCPAACTSEHVSYTACRLHLHLQYINTICLFLLVPLF